MHCSHKITTKKKRKNRNEENKIHERQRNVTKSHILFTITVYQANNQYINRFCQRLAASMKNYKIHAKKYLKYQKQKEK